MQRYCLKSPLLFAALVAALSAGSAGSAPLPRAVKACDGPHHACDASLLHKANIIGDIDDRGPINTHGPELGLSASEIDLIKHATGYVYCPGTKYGDRALGSGALIGSRSLIVTAAHTLIDEQSRRREPLDGCYFLPQTMPWKKFYLDFGRPYRIGTAHPLASADDIGRDYAIVHLKSAVEDAEPLPYSNEPVSEGDVIIGVSASQLRLSYVDNTQPVVQSCTVEDVFPEEAKAPTSYYADCDLAKGASGGANLIRTGTGLIIKGIFVGDGTAAHDHEPYDPQNHSFGYSIGIDGALADTITALASGRAGK